MVIGSTKEFIHGSALSHEGHTHSQYATTSDFNSLKTSVSNGKSAVASAITDKGVSTSATASFDTMAGNIRSISTIMNPAASEYGGIITAAHFIYILVCDKYPIQIPTTIIADIQVYSDSYATSNNSSEYDIYRDVNIPIRNYLPTTSEVNQNSTNITCTWSITDRLIINPNVYTASSYATCDRWTRITENRSYTGDITYLQYMCYDTDGKVTGTSQWLNIPYKVYRCNIGPFSNNRDYCYSSIVIKRLIY